jgi:hypothetical protein
VNVLNACVSHAQDSHAQRQPLCYLFIHLSTTEKDNAVSHVQLSQHTPYWKRRAPKAAALISAEDGGYMSAISLTAARGTVTAAFMIHEQKHAPGGLRRSSIGFQQDQASHAVAGTHPRPFANVVCGRPARPE